jgi:hypothetical protein
MAKFSEHGQGGGWGATFRATYEQVYRWLRENGVINESDIVDYFYCFRRNITALAPKGAKITYRGGGWWVLYGYSYNDRFMKLPDAY